MNVKDDQLCIKLVSQQLFLEYFIAQIMFMIFIFLIE